VYSSQALYIASSTCIPSELSRPVNIITSVFAQSTKSKFAVFPFAFRVNYYSILRKPSYANNDNSRSASALLG
jgi:hypothetical protein